MKILLKNVNLLNPHQKLNQTNANILIEDGVIKKIGEINIKESENSKVYELSGNM